MRERTITCQVFPATIEKVDQLIFVSRLGQDILHEIAKKLRNYWRLIPFLILKRQQKNVNAFFLFTFFCTLKRDFINAISEHPAVVCARLKIALFSNQSRELFRSLVITYDFVLYFFSFFFFNVIRVSEKRVKMNVRRR